MVDPYLEKSSDPKTPLTRHRKVPHLSRLEDTLRASSPGERLVLYILTGILALSAFALVAFVNKAVSVTVPARGGTLTEGVVGPVRFVNPLLALSRSDKDLTTLVYSGLMRANPNGELIPDLAENYDISEDGTTYTFTLRPNLTFHDGTPLTSADILFTIQRAQNPDVKSTRRADWEGVSVSAPDPHTVVFTLPHAYAPFLENTTLGILPQHLWEDVSAEEFPFHPLNTNPVGSGPYHVSNVDVSSTGSITRYNLSPFEKFSLDGPYLKKITFFFFSNEESLVDAFSAGRVDSIAGISPSVVGDLTRKDMFIVRPVLPRTFGVFFNQNKNTVFADIAVRAALDAAIDKEYLIDEVLKGFGVALDGPIPPDVLGIISPATPTMLVQETLSPDEQSANTEKARDILLRNGWTFDEEAQVWKKKGTVLQFTLATADEPELAATAELLAKEWRKAGIKVDVHVYSLSELSTVVLRPRNYEAVLFGEVVGRSLDLFAFWHSSQRNDPGLNLALYTNSKVDALLTHAREETQPLAREKLYTEFEELVANDQPAVFLYAPEFIYIVPADLHGIELGALTTPAERFVNVHEWYVNTEHVWNIFSKTNTE